MQKTLVPDGVHGEVGLHRSGYIRKGMGCHFPLHPVRGLKDVGLAPREEKEGEQEDKSKKGYLQNGVKLLLHTYISVSELRETCERAMTNLRCG